MHLRLIEPGKPNQNAYIELFNGRLRDERLKEHWFHSALHAQTEIENWRQEYNEKRPKKALADSRRLRETVNINPELKSGRY